MGGLLVSDADNSIGGAFRSQVERDGYTWKAYNLDTLSSEIDLSLYKWDDAQGVIVLDTALDDQQKRDATAAEAQRILANRHDAQQQEYDRAVRLNITPEADSYSYTARDGSTYTGRAALDHWGEDLRQMIREAQAGTLDPAEALPPPPA